MSLRERGGNWHYRFYAVGRTWTADTGLVATVRNRNAALIKEAEARKQVQGGKGDQLRIEVKTFSAAADQFIDWAKGEHRDKPQTWKRLRGSCTSLKMFFKHQPLHTITVGQILDYMAWRRGMEIKEVTLRHDLHCLSPIFQYGIAQNWCTRNPATSQSLEAHGSKMPSDADAVRIYVLSAAEENKYFDACLQPPQKIKVESKPHLQTRKGKRVTISGYTYEKLSSREYQDLHDIGRLMILQGPRPAEVMRARVEDIDLDKGTWFIPKSKSNAGKRTLKLTPEARSIFAKRISSAPISGWLFEGKKTGTHLKDVENSHLAILERTGMAFVIYDLRHTFATRFYQATRDVEALRKVLGHSNLRSIMKYVHISDDHVNAAMDRYEATLQPLSIRATVQ